MPAFKYYFSSLFLFYNFLQFKFLDFALAERAIRQGAAFGSGVETGWMTAGKPGLGRDLEVNMNLNVHLCMIKCIQRKI